MLELKSIKITNLASIENQVYYFNNDLSTIIGINKDTSLIDKSILDEELIKIPLVNLKSNGSGKTSIIEALHICLLGTCIKEKINTRQLIREGQESMRIELWCKNTYLGLSKIRIIREIYANKNKISKVELFETKEDGVEIEIPKTTSDNVDNYILNHYIGLSKEDIDNFFIIQKDRFKSFLLLPDKDKKEILSRFVGISNFNFIEEQLNEEIKSWSQEQINNDKKLSKEEGQKESFESIIKDSLSEKDFEKKKQERIDKIGTKINKDKTEITNNENQIFVIKKEIEKYKNIKSIWEKRKEKYNDYLYTHDLTKQIEKLNKEKEKIKKDYEEIENAIKEANKIKNNNIKSIDERDIIINRLKTLLRNLIECPKCKFKFNPKDNTSEEDINNKIKKQEEEQKSFNENNVEVEEDLKQLNILLKKTEEKLNEVGTKIEGIKSRKQRITNIGDYIDNQIFEYNRNIGRNNTKIEDLNFQINLIKKSIEQKNSSIEEIKKESYDSIVQNINKYKQKIKELELSIKGIQKEKDDLDKDIQLSKDSLLNYTLFKNYLYNKIILEIEYIVNSYLQNFSDLSVIIKGNKVLADGKSIRDEINCLITRNNKEISYFLLSSGEKAFIDIAFILTFQKILNTTSNNGLNFLVLDEITGTIDCANQEELLKSLDKLNKPILFITHIPTISNFKTTYVIKENNISKLYRYEDR